MKIFALFSLSLILFLATGSTAHAAWEGEWGSWQKPNEGAAIQIHKCDESFCKFQFVSEDGGGHSCGGAGKLEMKSEVEARASFDTRFKAKACALALNQTPEGKLKATLEGRDCLRLCSSEKAKALPPEMTLLSENVFQDVLPWPDCQTDVRPAAKLLCGDEKRAADFLRAMKEEKEAKSLQTKFYIAKAQQLGEIEDPFRSCASEEGVQECVDKSLQTKTEASRKALERLRSLRNKHEADLKTATKNKAAVENLKGTYTRKFKSGTSGGDKFEVTDDMKIGIDEGDLSFDLLLNFFDEQECTLSGTAKATNSGRFVFRDSGKGKGGNKNCKLIIFKEDGDLVLADDPPNSCQSHCGKGGSFFGARFPLSSRK